MDGMEHPGTKVKRHLFYAKLVFSFRLKIVYNFKIRVPYDVSSSTFLHASLWRGGRQSTYVRTYIRIILTYVLILPTYMLSTYYLRLYL
jgi:hypothetical protein